MSEFSSIYRGSVYDTQDPLKRGRIRVLVPMVLGPSPSAWAEPSVNTDPDTQVFIKDRVWVQFEGGDINRPIYTARQRVVLQDLAEEVTDGLGGMTPEQEAALANLQDDLGDLQDDLDTNNNLLDLLNTEIVPHINELLEQAHTDVDHLNSVVIPALNEALAAANAEGQEAASDIAALQTSLQDAHTDLDTLHNTTLPALNAQLSTIGEYAYDLNDKVNVVTSQVDTLNTTTLPALNAQLNVVNKAFFQNDPPVGTVTRALTLGDVWYDTNDGNKQYRYDGTGWTQFNVSIPDFSLTVRKFTSSTHQLY